jgi:uncharacterized protein (TIGR00266 family)
MEMQVEITYRPSYALAVVSLGSDESVQAEAGAMVSMSPDVAIETKAKGGLISALKRSVLGGESFFMNTYRASAQGGQIMLAPALPGDMAVMELQNETLMVQSGSYVGSSEGVEIDTKWSGAQTFFAREGLIMLKCSGVGTLILSSYGAIHEMELAAGEGYTVDTGHLVAFTEGMGFNVKRIGGVKSTLFSGEGLVVDLTGPGKVFLQTRSDDAFLSWLIPRLPKQSSSRR